MKYERIHQELHAIGFHVLSAKSITYEGREEQNMIRKFVVNVLDRPENLFYRKRGHATNFLSHQFGLNWESSSLINEDKC